MKRRVAKKKVGKKAASPKKLATAAGAVEVKRIDTAARRARGEEEWTRETADEDLLGVDAVRVSVFDWTWNISICAAEFVRTEPLQSELFDGISEALKRVPGVTAVAHEDREVWLVQGTPGGENLVRACASVVDRLAERMRPYVGS